MSTPFALSNVSLSNYQVPFSAAQLCQSPWASYFCWGLHALCSFLALLDFVSRATVMAQASIVRKLRFLGNRYMDPGQILWVALSPPYIQTIFFSFFQNFQFSNFCVNDGSKNFKTLPLLQFSSDLSQTLW